jgi:hypothetical protein
MPNYQNGKIYIIVCNITDECYIGSTTEPTLARRLAKHVKDYKVWKSGKSGKVYSYDIIGRGDYQMLLIENFPCNSRDELTSREGEMIRQYKMNSLCMNKNIAGRTIQQWKEDNKDKVKDMKKNYYINNKEKLDDNRKKWCEKNKDKLKERKKEYYAKHLEKLSQNNINYKQVNKEKIKQQQSERIECICGSCIRRGSKSQHERTIKHQDYLKTKM